MIQDIFDKLEKLKPVEKPLEFWRKVSEQRYENLVTGKQLDRIQFMRHQMQLGEFNIILKLS